MSRWSVWTRARPRPSWVQAHSDLQRLNEESADARERRRQAARRLVEAGYGPTWIGGQLGASKRAVDGFLRYAGRKGGE